MLSAGDTFHAADPRVDNHLWVVISDPAANPNDEVLIVNLTSWRKDREQICVLGPGDHPFVTHDTAVNYRESRLTTVQELERVLNEGALVRGTPVSPGVLERIRQGAAESQHIPLQNAELLKKQGLIE